MNADNTATTPKDAEEEELIPVEQKPEEGDVEDSEDDSEDDSEEDERLAQSEDDSEEDVASSGRHGRRRNRRAIQKRAREAAKRELEELRRTVAVLSQRVAQSETQAVTANANTAASTIQQQYADAIAKVQQAEQVMAAATEAGNGQDVVAAMRIRDQAIAEAQQLQYQHQQLEAYRQQATTPRVDPNVLSYAQEWMRANPWYDPNGGDRDSALTKAIDSELVREGYDPASRLYWEELTSRVADALGSADAESTGGTKSTARKGPPMGNTREHAPVSTKKEIYVTPERKQAMIEAGVWDDPVQRQRYLKAYQAYDRGSAR